MVGHTSAAGRVRIGAILALLGGVLLVTASALAQSPPGPPQPKISGTPQVGSTLTATWAGESLTPVGWQWLRCANTTGRCSEIAGATSDAYAVVSGDVGSVLRVRVTFTTSTGPGTARSDPTAVVTAGPQPPQPTPTPTPSPTPTPVAPPAPVVPKTDSDGGDTAGPASFQLPAAGSALPAASADRVLRPFPVVRIRGVLTTTGARITLLSVRASRTATVVARCRGRSCPLRQLARTAMVQRLTWLERNLSAGTKIDIIVTKPEQIGKWTKIRIRRGAPPKRWDRCVYPSGTRPVRCPE
jgi:hypothetical protein